MTQFRLTVNLVCLLLLVAAIVAPSNAVHFTVPSRPAIIATVNLEKVFNNNDGWAQTRIELVELGEDLQAQAEAMRDEADLLKQDLDLLVPGTPKFQKAEKEWKQAILSFRAQVDFTKAKLDAERAKAARENYQQIFDAAQRFCLANGIDFILTDDSGIDLEGANDMQVIQQMSLRQIVYANQTLDVTDDLLAWINKR